MEWLGDLNYVAVVVGSVLSFLIGWLWYSPVMFGKVWQAHYKLSDEDMKAGMGRSMGLGFIFTFITGLAMAALLESGVASSIIDGVHQPAVNDLMLSLKLALLCGGGFILIWSLMGAAYTRKPMGLAFAEGLFGVVTLVVFALVIAGWNEVF